MNEDVVKDMLNSQIGLDDTFRFKCRGCGKCCKQREDVLLTTRDVYNMAKKLSITMNEAIDKYCEVYIGESSRMPLVRILPRGVNRACPLLKDKRCLIHDAKPVICAMFPVGRILIADEQENGLTPDTPFKAGYILNPVTCGSAKKQYTVRSWLEQFGIPIEDEFYIQWNKMLLFISPFFMEVEKAKAPEVFMQSIWGKTYELLYCEYDLNRELMPQFTENSTKLVESLQELKKKLVENGLLPESTNNV